jgi:hypothetical protein
MALLSVNRGFLATLPKPVTPMQIVHRSRKVEAARGTGMISLVHTNRPSTMLCHCITAPRSDRHLKPSLTPNYRGTPGEEVEDIKPNMAYARRRSNSSTHNMKDFKTKFETIETEPVFEEELHGPIGEELEKQSTTSSDKSVDEEEHDKKH